MNTHTPDLKIVTGRPFSIFCRHCGKATIAGDGCDTMADHAGEPWVAYFHANCASHAGEYPAGVGVTA